MEQLARDARITTIYEGTTGIQALDLLGARSAAAGRRHAPASSALIQRSATSTWPTAR
jgi:alkylation response protein AidB-like acyl-CoA dehydrogenase